MSIVELEKAVAQLPPEDLTKFSEWFDEYLSEKWEGRIERDLAEGKLEGALAQVDDDIRAGRFKPL